ncbi:hypothetical protein [Nocardia testacea]|uniref:Uncharacterized protein n=1 Tax=Nocardia testacea TaxID=248551 RepID=A0ABW7VY14_9NOCA
MLDRQHAAHVEVLILADRVVDSTRVLFDRVSFFADDDKIAEARRAHQETFSAIHAGKGAAQLAGPEDLVYKLGNFMVALTKQYGLIEKYAESNGAIGTYDELSAAANEMDETRTAYILAAQKLLK